VTSAAAPPPGQSEFRELVRLLRRHAEVHLDQWERWKVPTSFGEVFIEMRRSPNPGDDPDSFDDLSLWLSEE